MKLRYYVLRRLLSSFITLILVIFAAFLVLYISIVQLPFGLPRAFGVSGPFPYVFAAFLKNILTGNWGYNTGVSSYYSNRSFVWIVSLLLPYTLQLIIGTLIVSLAITIPLGSHIAMRRNSTRDYAARVWSFVTYGMPILFSSYFVLLLFAKGGYAGTGLPDSGMYTIGASGPPPFLKEGITYPTHFALVDGLLNGDYAFAYSAFLHLIMPVMALSMWTSAALVRFMRSEMLENVNEPYVMAAYSRGIADKNVRRKYIRRNSYIPFLTAIGPLYSGLIGWSVLIEFIFGYHGIGYFMMLSAYNLYMKGFAICLLTLGVTVIALNFIIDLVYAYLDPRIRY